MKSGWNLTEGVKELGAWTWVDSCVLEIDRLRSEIVVLETLWLGEMGLVGL